MRNVQARDRIFVKGYGFGKNISKNLSAKYNQKLLDPTKQSATDALKNTSKQLISVTAEVTGSFINNKIADKITKILKSL